MQRYVTDLQCLRCRAQRVRAVTHLDNVLGSVSCSVCGATLHEARRHPLSFVFHYLPRGLVSKPREVLEEWGTLSRTSQATAADDRRSVASGTRN